MLQFECLSIKILVIDTGRKQGGGREKEGERKQFFFKYYSHDGAQDIFRMQVGLISINIIPLPVFFININILALGMPPGSFIPAVFCIGFRGKSRRALKKIYLYIKIEPICYIHSELLAVQYLSREADLIIKYN